MFREHVRIWLAFQAQSACVRRRLGGMMKEMHSCWNVFSWKRRRKKSSGIEKTVTLVTGGSSIFINDHCCNRSEKCLPQILLVLIGS